MRQENRNNCCPYSVCTLLILMNVFLETSSSPACNQYGFYCEDERSVRLCNENVTLSCPEATFCSNFCPGECTRDTSVCQRRSPRSLLKELLTTDIAFECPSEGRFVDPNSECTKYYQCVKDPSNANKFNILAIFECPSNSKYNIEAGRCMIAENVKCPEAKCNTYGFYCVTSTKVQLCADDSPPSGKITECPPGFICNMHCSSECFPESQVSFCPSSSENLFTCESEGLFADPVDCHYFYACTKNSQGGFHQLSVKCPQGYVFDKKAKLCTKSSGTECT